MAAKLKIYRDKELRYELDTTSGIYTYLLGGDSGLNGDDGEVYTETLYAFNVGDTPALNLTIRKYNDPNNFISVGSISDDGFETVTFVQNSGLVGDVAVGAVRPIYIRIAIPKYTTPELRQVNFQTAYFTLP